MSKCKNCGDEIAWGKHPQNPEKSCPFNADGTIHFSTCRARKEDAAVYDTIDMIEGRCIRGSKPVHVHWWINRGGGKVLRASCGCGYMHHVRTIPTNEENKALINHRPLTRCDEMDDDFGYARVPTMDELMSAGLDEYLPD